MTYRFAFVMEQTLGQITHTQNFRQWVATDPTVEPLWILIGYDSPSRIGVVPVVGRNWTIRASFEARARIHEVLRTGRIDALFLHTQVTALLAHRLMTRIPSIVSMDATPLNFDSVGGPYGHHPSRYRQIEAAKNALTRRTFRRARKLVIWHQAGKRSLVADYGVSAERVLVIPPGIDMDTWRFDRSSVPQGRVRLLFVGGHFRRKGGDVLLSAFRNRLASHCELDIVTRDPVDTTGMDNVRVHQDLAPNMPELLALYGRADIFVFPTFADMLPLAIMEAMAASLPVVTTAVGAIPEQVDDGATGFLVPPGDEHALADAILRIVHDGALRRKMGAAARRVAEQRYDGARNYPAILEACKSCVHDAQALTR
jgi:glycosyltransferase involved in cell wall biosynthesis